MKALYIFLKRVIKFFRFTYKEKRLLVEAFILTGIMRLVILIIPFRNVSSIIGRYMGETSIEISEAERLIVKEIGWVISVISIHTPWKSKCLVQALAAQLMLRRRRIGSTLYLGVAKGSKNHIISHAWLRTGSVIVTGGFERKWFKEVARFAYERGEKKQ